MWTYWGTNYGRGTGFTLPFKAEALKVLPQLHKVLMIIYLKENILKHFTHLLSFHSAPFFFTEVNTLMCHKVCWYEMLD